MYGKFVDAVCVALVMVSTIFFALPELAFAQSSQTITVEAPSIDWTSIPSQVLSAITTPIIVGIGIALSIWVLFAGVKFFRRSAT